MVKGGVKVIPWLFFFSHEKGKSLFQLEASHQQLVRERECFNQDKRSLFMSQQLLTIWSLVVVTESRQTRGFLPYVVET